MKRLDLVGQRKHKILITGFSHSHTQPSGQKRAIWDFICDCGTRSKISTSNFTHGTTVSCGCVHKTRLAQGFNKKPYGEATFNYKYQQYKIRAKTHRKKICFDLTKEQFRDLIVAPCFYCGTVNSSTSKSKPNANGNFPSNGIDRLDPDVGYTVANCVTACGVCNIMKNNLSYSDFISRVRKIAQNAPSSLDQ